MLVKVGKTLINTDHVVRVQLDVTRDDFDRLRRYQSHIHFITGKFIEVWTEDLLAAFDWQIAPSD